MLDAIESGQLRERVHNGQKQVGWDYGTESTTSGSKNDVVAQRALICKLMNVYGIFDNGTVHRTMHK